MALPGFDSSKSAFVTPWSWQKSGSRHEEISYIWDIIALTTIYYYLESSPYQFLNDDVYAYYDASQNE